MNRDYEREYTVRGRELRVAFDVTDVEWDQGWVEDFDISAVCVWSERRKQFVEISKRLRRVLDRCIFNDKPLYERITRDLIALAEMRE